jgi:hypothetical protein
VHPAPLWFSTRSSRTRKWASHRAGDRYFAKTFRLAVIRPIFGLAPRRKLFRILLELMGIDERIVLIAFVPAIQPSQDHADFIPAAFDELLATPCRQVDDFGARWRGRNGEHRNSSDQRSNTPDFHRSPQSAAQCDSGPAHVCRFLAPATRPERITTA